MSHLQQQRHIESGSYLNMETLPTDHAFPSNEPYILGIDEAGRGPVLGPMVYGCAYCPISQKAILANMGFDDSKKLSEKDRDRLFDKIDASPILGHYCISLSAAEISQNMLKICKKNLNLISHETAADLIRHILAQGVNIQEVYVDTVGDPAKYRAKLANEFPSIHTITVSAKADSLFPIVSAASICAKVIRDFHLKNWIFPEKASFSHSFGSGYPSDPNTKSWLRKSSDPVFGFPTVIRFSWKTTDNLLKSVKAAQIRWEVEDHEEADVVKESQKKRKYGKAAKTTTAAAPSHVTIEGDLITPAMLKRQKISKGDGARQTFFVERNIYHVCDL